MTHILFAFNGVRAKYNLPTYVSPSLEVTQEPFIKVILERVRKLEISSAKDRKRINELEEKVSSLGNFTLNEHITAAASKKDKVRTMVLESAAIENQAIISALQSASLEDRKRISSLEATHIDDRGHIKTLENKLKNLQTQNSAIERVLEFGATEQLDTNTLV